jgi:peptidoglycan/LPS O-acetylase OafA/YrhL
VVTNATLAPEHTEDRGARPARPGSFDHLPALDGLRGVAVLAVVAYHADLGWAGGGFLGVDVFFVLSGYLITSLLRAEHGRTGRVSLRGFWTRRARRLLPALGCMFLAVVVFAALRPEHPGLTNLRADMLAGLGYVANWRFVLADQGYFAEFAPSPLRHLWSLAIEEQFYLLWPLVFLAVARLRHAGWVVLALAGTSAALMVAGSGATDPSRIYYGTDTHAHGLLIGAALAYVTVPARRWLSLAGWAAAVLAVVLMTQLRSTDPDVWRGGLLAFEVLVAVVIAACARPEVPASPGRALAWRPLRAVGLVSYGVYLWHWPVFVLCDEQLLGLSGTPLLAVQLAITAALALTSFYLVERPFRSGRLPGRYGIAWVPVGAGALVAGLLVVSATLESPIAAAQRARAEQEMPADSDDYRVLLVGDSSANTLAPGITPRPEGLDFEVTNATVDGCSLDWTAEAVRGSRGWHPLERGDCDWSKRWPPLLRRVRPDLVLLSYGLWDVGDRRVDGRELAYESEAWHDHMTTVVERAIDVATSTDADVGFLLSASLLSRPSIGPVNELYRAVGGRRGAAIFELGVVANRHGAEYRWDGVHYTPAGAEAVGAEVSEWIEQIADPGRHAPLRTTQSSSAGHRRAHDASTNSV